MRTNLSWTMKYLVTMFTGHYEQEVLEEIVTTNEVYYPGMIEKYIFKNLIHIFLLFRLPRYTSTKAWA